MDPSPRIKFEVDARANDVVREFDIQWGRGERSTNAIDVTGNAAEIGIKIFGLGGPVRRKGEFKPGAGGPAYLCGGLKRSAIETGLHRSERGAACPVEQDPVKRPAG